jgi:thiamine-monophosphate kinase
VITRLLAGRSPPPPWLQVDAGHDCAVVEPRGPLALTVDALVEGAHFDERLSPADVGFKTIAVSVSDLAAGGASPAFALLSVSLPDDPRREPFVDGFATGLREACARWGVYVLGGDTTRSPGPIVVSATLGGFCVGRPHRRDGGRPGDRLWVTGALGRAAAGWSQASPPDSALAALRRPDPPVPFALALASAGLATAVMDLSDGLAADLPRLCSASGVGVRVDPERVPVAPEADLSLAVGGGEDYELLFAAPADAGDRVAALAVASGVRVTAIGELVAGHVLAFGTSAWPVPLFAHFREPS